MASENKSLEIGVVVNEGQMSKFNTAIRDATREVSKLTAELNRAASAFKGFLSGAQMQGGGAQFRPGSGFARAPMAGGGGMTQPALAIATAIKATAKESTDALRGMDTAVRTASTKMAGNLDVFDRALKSVETRLKNIKSINASGALIPGLGSQNEPFFEKGSRVVNRGGVDYVQGPSTLERLKARLDQSPTWQAMNRPMWGDESRDLGGMRGAMGRVGIGVGAGVAAYGAIQSTVVSRDNFNSQEAMSAQTDALRRQVTMQQSIGDYSMRLRRNGMTQLAYSRLTPNDLHAMFSDESFQAQLQQSYSKNGGTGSIKEVGADLKDRMSMMFGMSSGPLKNDNSQLHQVMDRAINDVKPEMMQRAVQIAQQREAAMSPEQRTYLGEFFGEVGQRMNLARLSGRGNPRVNPHTRERYDFGMTLGLGTAYSPDEMANQMARIGGTAGRGAMSEDLARSTLAAQYGGFGNAVDTFNVGNQYGNRGLFGAVQGGIGGGGMDVTAGSQVAGLVGQQMTAGNVSIGGSAAAQGMLSAFSTGSTGGDMRMARMASGGVGAYDSMLSGGVDNLQKAINVMAANKSAGGMSVHAKHALEGIGSVQLIEILRSKKVPQELADYGITLPMIQSYVSTQNKFAYSRYIAGTGNGGAVEAAVLGARKAGGAGAYISGLIEKGGLKAGGRGARNLIQEQARLLGQAQHSMGLAPTNEAGMARVLMEVGQSSDLLPNLRGGGAYDAAAKTLAAERKKQEDFDKLRKETFIEENREDLVNAGGYGSTAAADALDTSSISGDTGKLHVALLGFVDEIKKATRDMRTARNGGNDKATGK